MPSRSRPPNTPRSAERTAPEPAVPAAEFAAQTEEAAIAEALSGHPGAKTEEAPAAGEKSDADAADEPKGSVWPE